jgi:demethylmenaquinone methyltransferase/2-methoxy-6-polyprenyl-1,4-benzoquinol methylase
MDSLEGYYARRAAEYERIYAKPERQRDLAALRSKVATLAAGRRVLEIACGTGYWTQVMAPVAASVTAVDAADETLQIARSKRFPQGRVHFLRADAYALPDFGRSHDAAFAGFWWSHIPLARLDAFLDGLGSALAPGAAIAFLDNRYVEGSSTPISRRDAGGNTYQTRTLDDASRHEVLKNFPLPEELHERAARRGDEVSLEQLEYYWLLCYRTRRDG